MPEPCPLHYYFEAAGAALRNLKEALASRQIFDEAREVLDMEMRVNGIALVVTERGNKEQPK